MKISTSTLSYHDKLKQSDREAAYTLGGAVLVTVVFWAAVFLTADSLITYFGVPLWFWLSCIGGYGLSVAVVVLLVRYVFQDFDLSANADEGENA